MENTSPYHIVGKNPDKVIRKGFEDELIRYILKLKIMGLIIEKTYLNLEILCSSDLDGLNQLSDLI